MKITKDFIIEKIKEISKQIGTSSLPKKVFIVESGISEYEYLKHFNTWNEAVIAAGLETQDFAKPYEKEELFQNLKEVFEKSEGLCSRTKFNKISSISHDSYRRHFGSWQEALVNFKKWLEDNKYDYPWVAELPDNLSSEIIEENQEITSEETDFKKQWNASTGNKYGSFLNFRGLQHAPINEQGVVFLFGMVCLELGFIVEAVQSGFPDCEAKRRIDNKKDHWERVRIEFEYRSSNFQEHGHNPTKCDLIVCWEHNWKECPIEVIELKKVLSELED
ncbi:MAG: hypothetical protein NTW44_06830 [Nitrospirae bacterium]|nr:hypothetical protein [Nitrospirota bacterium]